MNDLLGRAQVFVGVDQPLELRTQAVLPPSSGEILVEIIACTLCGSDVHSYHGRRTIATPMVLGHEILGKVVALGESAPRRDYAGEPLTIGKRVTWGIVANCSDCFYCERGLPQKCLRGVKYGHEVLSAQHAWRGGLADYCLLAPGTAVLNVPAALDDATACPANCATATVAAACDAAGDMQDRAVLVLGAGMLGVTACAMTRWLGAARVICCDVNEPRAQQSLQFGATATCSPGELASVLADHVGPHGVDVVLELTGATSALDMGLRALRIGGTLVEVGAVFPTPAIELLPEQLVRRQLTLRGIHNYAPRHLLQALTFLAANTHYPWSTLVGAWYALDDCGLAIAAAASGKSFRVGVRPRLG